jgi:Ca2+/Na+ antiporter
MTILRSILITSIVSILFGFALRNVFGFWEALSLAFVLQFIVAFITSSFKINRVENLTNEFEGELEQLLSLSETTIACPCGNYTFTENIFANVESTYVCEKCNNEFKLDVTVTPTLLTQPVNVDQPITALKDDIEITSEYKQGTEL